MSSAESKFELRASYYGSAWQRVLLVLLVLGAGGVTMVVTAVALKVGF